MSITNINIYGMEGATIACGYPMATDVHGITPSYERLKKLGNAKAGSGHDCALKGVVVQFDWKNSLIQQRQVLRYHFIDIISSQSTMHRALRMDLKKQCNDYVLPSIIETVQALIDNYNEVVKTADKETLKELELEIFYNLPAGYELTARYTTNYLQLKTIYEQRKNHKLPEWGAFCAWCLTLPRFVELTGVAV